MLRIFCTIFLPPFYPVSHQHSSHKHVLFSDLENSVDSDQLASSEARTLFLCPQSSFGRHIHPSFPLRVRCISPLFFDVGIPNLVCGCMLDIQFGVCMHVWMTKCCVSSLGHCDRDLISRSGIESGAYLLYSLRWEFQIWCKNASWNGCVSHTIFWSL